MLQIQKATNPVLSNRQSNTTVSRFAVTIFVAIVIGFAGIVAISTIPDFATNLYRVFQEGAMLLVLLLIPGVLIGAMVNHFRKRNYL